MSRLSLRTFETQDTRGCTFSVTASYQTEYAWDKLKMKTVKVKNHCYKAMGFETTTLKEMKILIGKI